jgi:CHAT domain-containing protein/tetratricopeptide (TPR) repeat protein
MYLYRTSLQIVLLTGILLPQSLLFANTGLAEKPFPPQAQDAQQETARQMLDRAIQQHNEGDFQVALKLYQQALAAYRKESDSPDERKQQQAGEAETLFRLAWLFEGVNQYPKAIESYQQALPIYRELGDRIREGRILNNLGLAYINGGQYDQALDVLTPALAIRREVSDRVGEGRTLVNLGLVSYYRGQYSNALELYQQSLTIRREVGDRDGEAITLNNIGLVYTELGQYARAQEFYQQALAIYKAITNRMGEGKSLQNIGYTYELQKQYTPAISTYQTALKVFQQINNRFNEGRVLNNLGFAYIATRQYSQAQQSLERALILTRESGDRQFEGRTLGSLATVYKAQDNDAKTIEFYQKALAIQEELGDREGQRINFSHLAELFQKQKRTELAILFYKQSVNTTEEIRTGLRDRPRAEQQTYTQRIAPIYRQLADLLLQQNRIIEAQRVLDLLKIQELDDYLHNVRGNTKTAQGIEVLPLERQVFQDYREIQTRAIRLGKELSQLRKILPNQLTPTQQQRMAELVKGQEELTKEFNRFINSPEVELLINRLSPNARDQVLSLRRLRGIQDDLERLQQHAVLLYPVVLEDRLELLLTTPDIPPIRRRVNVSRKELNQTILEFREALQDPGKDATIPAKKLYSWLIKPIESDLAQAEAETIIYSPDDQLRYVPLAALYDGKQWLTERFRINYITADSLAELNTQPQRLPRVLAAAYTQGSYSIKIGEQKFTFQGLKYAGREIEDLSSGFPETTKLLDRQFSRDAVIPKMDSYNVIHLATHAALVVGKPEESFILFGNGEWVTLRDVESWSLRNVDLVMLSACETGLNGKLGNGEEILGFGYLIHQAGARATIASLWTVDDSGTQILMNAFYSALRRSNTTKAEALRQAQITMIRNGGREIGQTRGDSFVLPSMNSSKPTISLNLSHPYYWAPFILIGNGL